MFTRQNESDRIWTSGTRPGFSADLVWAGEVVASIESGLDLTIGHPSDRRNTEANEIVSGLESKVRERGIWGPHLPSDYGGSAYSCVERTLLNEVLGGSRWAPRVFGYDIDEYPNAMIIETHGTDDQRSRFSRPILAGQMASAWAMTEPKVGSTKSLLTTYAAREGSDWVLNGQKWFSESAAYAEVILVMAVTKASRPERDGMLSVFLVPSDTPGLSVTAGRPLGGMSESDRSFSSIVFDNVRLPSTCLMGQAGQAFRVTQAVDPIGQFHHQARALGPMRRCLEMMRERIANYEVRGGPLRDMQMSHHSLAQAWLRYQQFRTFILQAAWATDHCSAETAALAVATVKAVAPGVYFDIVQRSMHIHGAVGMSSETPFASWLLAANALAVAEGPTEVHEMAISEALLGDVSSHVEPAWPSMHLPTMQQQAAGSGHPSG